jgi:hypothetical protein
MKGQHNECEIIPSCNEISSHIGDENTGSKKIKKNIDTPCSLPLLHPCFHHQHFAKTRLIPHFSDHQMFSYHL